MKQKPIVALAGIILFQLFSPKTFAQNGQSYFYYYKGKKVQLEVNTNRVALSLEVNNSLSTPEKVLSDHGIAPLLVKEDNTEESVNAIPGKGADRKGAKPFYSEVEIKGAGNQETYEEKIKGYSKLSGVLKASPCFTLKNGKNAGLTAFFYVQLKEQKDSSLLFTLADRNGIFVTGSNRYMPLWFTLSCEKQSNLNALEAANLFYETGLFENTEPAFIYENLLLSADPLFGIQWGLKNTGQNSSQYAGIDIKAEDAWTMTKGASSIKVAIFDQGFEMTHPDLKNNVSGTGFNAATGRTPSQVLGSHATACAGVVGAVQNNNLGISGVAPGCRLMSISINMLSSDPPQSFADGINWAWKNGADVINNSWGGMNPSGIIDNAITNALTNGRSGKGTVVVFATGNANGSVFYPANSNPKIIAVGAISFCGERKSSVSCDRKAWGSNYGPEVDVVAPGVSIATTDRVGTAGFISGDYYTAFGGTSAACPYVAGVAALVLSANSALKVQEVNDIIERATQKVRPDIYNYEFKSERPNGGWNEETGYGLVDAAQAIRLANPIGSFSCFPPEVITCGKTTPNSITVLWEKAESAVSYSLEYKETTEDTWTTTPDNYDTSYTIKKLDKNKVYDIRIKTNCETGSSEYASTQCSTFNNNNKNETGIPGQSMNILREGTDDRQEKALSIYPNPAENFINIGIPFKGNYTGAIIDMFGRRVISFADAKTRLGLSLKGLTPGLYTVTITAKEGTTLHQSFLVK